MRYKEVVFSYTLKCDCLCAHCCLDCSPQRWEKIGYNLARNYIKELAKNNIRYIAFTGGEPLLFLKELYGLMGLANNFGIKSIIVTNAKWAKSENIANKRASNLAKLGLREIQISTDRFHLQCVPFENVINAIKAFKRFNVKVTILIARINKDSIADKLKNKLKKYGVRVIEQAIVPFSKRSYSLLKEYPFSTIKLSKMKEIGCRSTLSPTIASNQKMYICCSADFNFIKEFSPLILGDLKKNNLSKLIKEAQVNRIIDVLYLWGPKGLFNLIKKKIKNKKIKRKYNGYCDLCYTLLNNKNIIKIIKKTLKEKSVIYKIEAAKIFKKFDKEKNIKRNKWWKDEEFNKIKEIR